jgi:RimJ/RimL family protein N-acetyltransferase
VDIAGTVPRLETARTVMRGHTIGDFEASARMWSDLEVVRKISGRPSSREESWSRLLRHIGHWQALGFGYWLVEDRGTGEFLGEVGFADYRRGIEPPPGGLPEIGWVMCVAAQGRGLGSEAVAAAVRWADEQLTFAKTVCFMLPDHDASIRIAEKCGYRESGPARYRDVDVLVMERPRFGSG